jgi:hypothetical protein
MPVIEKGDSAAAKKALTGGEIDLNPPYADEKEISDKSSSNESRRRRNDNEYMMERWQKMAGLIKG